jgi:uncharacterized membrane protein YhdT
MVIAFIFLVHLIFTIYIFIKKWKQNSIGEALIDLVLIIILFSVGWSITTMISKLFWEPIGFGKYFDRNTIALTILTIGEFFFYRTYYKDLSKKNNTTANEKEK